MSVDRTDEEASLELNHTDANGIATSGVAASSAATDKLYEPKNTSKMVVLRVLTVFAYVFSVSLAAILLSAYYVFLWKPSTHSKERLEYYAAEQERYYTTAYEETTP